LEEHDITLAKKLSIRLPFNAYSESIVLKLQAHHISVLDEKEGKIELNLLFQKTNQFKGKFVLNKPLIKTLSTNE
jgi:hypothetical protein